MQPERPESRQIRVVHCLLPADLPDHSLRSLHCGRGLRGPAGGGEPGPDQILYCRERALANLPGPTLVRVPTSHEILRIVLVSPSDVTPERDQIDQLVDRLSRNVWTARGYRVEVFRWESDVYPGLHLQGPQGLIDDTMEIEEADVVIGLFGSRLGSPISREPGSQTGTEHELTKAWTSWESSGSPQVLLYFGAPVGSENAEQAQQVLDLMHFKHRVPSEQLWRKWNSAAELVDQVEHDLNILFESAVRRSSAAAPYEADGMTATLSNQSAGGSSDDWWMSPLQDSALDDEAIDAYVENLRDEIAKRHNGLSGRSVLYELGLFDEDPVSRCTYLLFGRRPSDRIGGAYVNCVSYAGDTKNSDRESEIIEGPLQSQIEGAIRFVRERSPRRERPSERGAKADIAYRYPLTCVRELIANALVHRDYSDESRIVHVSLYSDRVEISSPGQWFASDHLDAQGVRASQLAQHSIRRNPRLTRALAYTHFVEGEGSGLAVSVADCALIGAPEPVIRSEEGFTIATVRPSQRPPDKESASVTSVPAGWYDDPSGRYQLRYWDAEAWTEHVSASGQQFKDPPVA